MITNHIKIRDLEQTVTRLTGSRDVSISRSNTGGFDFRFGGEIKHFESKKQIQHFIFTRLSYF